jgi:hypothetical protein
MGLLLLVRYYLVTWLPHLKKLWDHLKNLGYRGKKQEGPKIVLNIDDEKCHDAKKIADHFNNFFLQLLHVNLSLPYRLPKEFLLTHQNLLEIFIEEEIFVKIC